MEKPTPGSPPAKPSGASPPAPADLQSTQAQAQTSPPGPETVVVPSQPTAAAAQLGATQAAPAAPGVQSTQAHEPTKGPEGKTIAGEQAEAAKQTAAKEQKISSLGDFRLLKKLGEGGMGAVYKAHQVSLDRDVAVKVLFKHLASNPDFVERFQREARIMAKLDHPNILRCYNVGEEHGWRYFAMEFVDGGSLQGVLDKHGKLSLGDALHVTIACAKGLQHAHELNMIHRDVKPDNILFTKKGVVKVADMGLAKAHGENVSVTRTGTGAGTPVYMSPEQARDAKHVDHRSDIYSLGCMLYTLLAGKPPFSGETYVELFEAKEKGKFDPVRKHNDEVPERLDLMIDKMLSKDPKLRYQTCAEVVKDLEAFGLASTTLSFLEPEADPAAKPTAAAAPGKNLGQTKPAVSATKVSGIRPGAAPSQGASAAKGPGARSDLWDLSYRNSKGKLIKKRMSTDQVRELIKDDDFDLKAQAKRIDHVSFRALATYAEFEGVLRGKIAKERADRKTSKFQDMYKKLEEEEIRRQRWKWFRRMYESAGGFVIFLFWMALVGALLVAGYFGVRYGLKYIEKFMEKATAFHQSAPSELNRQHEGFTRVSERLSTSALYFSEKVIG
jgi:serine/threonine protein kinase